MALVPLITIVEADSYNALSSEWLALADANKDSHIYKAGLYMQAKFTCADVDWSDPSTLDDDLKRACAYYAEADRIGILFDEIAPVDIRGSLIEEKKKLGTMEKTQKWESSNNVASVRPLESIDSIVLLYCTKLINSNKLIRV